MVGIAQSYINLPFKELSFELSYKCPLNCIYCSSDANIRKKQALKIKQIIKVIKECKKKFNIDTVSLSGGEAFIYPHFLKLINYLKKNRYNIIIYSSGVIVDNKHQLAPLPLSVLKAIRLSKNNPKLFLNLQGHNKQLVEKINRTKGSFSIIEESIKNIRIAGLFLGANIVPLKDNYKHLKEIVNYCTKCRFNEASFLRFVPQGRGAIYCPINTKKELRNINERIKIILQENKIKSRIKIKVGHPINFLFLLGKGLYPSEKIHYCRGGLDAPLIQPNGNVCMCPAWKDLQQFKAGNIYKQDFSEIWNSNNFKIFRQFIKENYSKLKTPCRSCKFLEECRGKCVAQRLLAQKNKLDKCNLNDLLLFAPDPQCFLRR